LKHDLSLKGHAFTLRPVGVEDAGFIVGLRASRGTFLNRGATSEAGQREWIERYFARLDDYFFVVERNDDHRAEGLVGIYDIDREDGTAEWGRFVVLQGSRAAVEAALLIYRCGFDVMGLDVLRGRTLADNSQVVSFHDSCGIPRTPGTILIDHDGHLREAIEHVLSKEAWPVVRGRLDAMAARLAAPLGRAQR
jgi:RimJ/RimL family protein N-acetyltransferase